jgi:CheY-like chemotaxis protein
MTATDVGSADLQAVRAVVAEDDPVARVVLEGILAKAGLDPVVARDGAEAWKVIEGRDEPLLVLMDWMMPGLDGIELSRRIRARKWRVEPYVIMVTVRAGTADVVEGLEAGANDYVTKPLDPAELRARIAVGLKYLRLRAELVRQLEELRHALEHVRTLQGIIPICSYCHKVRDDQQAWHRMEAYVARNTGAEFSHGICPDCERQHFADLDDDESGVAR